LVFALYVGDLDLWVGSGHLGAYADDTFVTVEADNELELREKLEREGEEILKYFASNQLVANPSKSALIVFRQKCLQREPFRIRLSGEEVEETTDEKLLGIFIQSDLKWGRQIDKVTSECNYAMSILRRLKEHLAKKELRTIADGLVMSKLRYCLPVYAAESLRLRDSDPHTIVQQRLQLIQNDMLRVIEHKRRRDHVRIADLLDDTNLLSINQATAYALVIELWKARTFNVPILGNLLERERNDERTLRSDSSGRVSTVGSDTVALNCERLWNMSSTKFKRTNLLKVAKIEAKKLAKSLPI